MNENEFISILRNELQPIKDEMETYREDFSKLRNELQPIKDGMETYQEDISKLRNELQLIKDGMETHQEDISRLRNELQPIKDEIKAFRDDIEVLKIKSDLTHKKLDNLSLDVKLAERGIRRDIAHLQDAQETVITVLEHKNILPKAE